MYLYLYFYLFHTNPSSYPSAIALLSVTVGREGSVSSTHCIDSSIAFALLPGLYYGHWAVEQCELSPSK
nr:hypothetical protein Q903MT_gene246 [Picea sitchensis]